MTTNVIMLRQKALVPFHVSEGAPSADVPLAVSIPPELARSIRYTAGMHSKDPQEFLIDWLRSGFPEAAA
jgi:hypothetical protein